MASLHRFPVFSVLPAHLTSRSPLPVSLVIAAAALSSFFCPHPDAPSPYLPLPSTLLQPPSHALRGAPRATCYMYPDALRATREYVDALEANARRQAYRVAQEVYRNGQHRAAGWHSHCMRSFTPRRFHARQRDCMELPERGVAGTTNRAAYHRWFFVVHSHPRDPDVPAVHAGHRAETAMNNQFHKV